MQEFIAITDDLLYDHPELFERLVPYHVDRPCHRLLGTRSGDCRDHATPADLQSDIRDLVSARSRGE